MKKTKDKRSHYYLKYSGMVMQLFVMLMLLSYLGSYLDQKFQFSESYFTAGLLLVGTVAYLYKIVKELT